MSNIFNCQKITKSFGAQTLFKDIDFIMDDGDRVGIIGPNGSGKSTFLKILCQLEDADSGNILYRKHLQMSYLAQDDIFDENETLEEALMSVLKDALVKESEKFSRVHSLLSRAEFVDTGVKVSLLSGGWRKRLAICRALVTQPQLLVMDEPTNHLDIEGIIWLEKMFGGGLAEMSTSYVIVSHDRCFLENCTNRVVEISAVYPEGSFGVKGNYSVFLEKREDFLTSQAEQEVRLSNKVKRETEWLRRGPKARTTKAQYRIDEAYRLGDKLQEVKSRNRAIGTVKMDFDGTGRKTKKLLEALSVTKSYGDMLLFSDLDILLSPGTRLGLLGRNGCGKSTLMKILAGEDSEESAVDAGIIKKAEGVQVVSFDQKREQLDLELSLKRALAPDGDSVVYQDRSVHVVSWAQRFLFKPEQLETPVAQLSGGEQARILLARLMRQKADILLLDEPTNDLDIDSLDVLEESLAGFPGAVVLVCHDRFLLDRVCDVVLGFDGEGGASYFAEYSQWLTDLHKKQQLKEASQRPKGETKKKEKKKKAGRLSYMDQREYDSIEERIMDGELKVEGLQAAIEDPAISTDPGLLDSHWQELQTLQAVVEGLYSRWDELEEKLKGEGG